MPWKNRPCCVGRNGERRLLAMLEEKTKGRKITIAPKAPARGGVIDLMEALKESMRTVQRKSPTEQKKRKKA
jgi:non-homologous end joining protein Ku